MSHMQFVHTLRTKGGSIHGEGGAEEGKRGEEVEMHGLRARWKGSEDLGEVR
jgi:hypothetical protein